MKDRGNCCPKCGYHLLARKGDMVFCLHAMCDWEILAKRKDDKDIPDIAKLIKEWNG